MKALDLRRQSDERPPVGFFDKYAPEIVRAAHTAEKENPRPVLEPSYPEPSEASRAEGYGIAAWVAQFACAFVGLPLAFYARSIALTELRGIAAGRRSPAGRRKAILGWWLGQGLIWVWLFTFVLILVVGVIVIPIVIVTS
jgi:hypothetical protein